MATPVVNLPFTPNPRQVDPSSSIPSQCKAECTSLVSLYNDCLRDLNKCMSLCEVSICLGRACSWFRRAQCPVMDENAGSECLKKWQSLASLA